MVGKGHPNRDRKSDATSTTPMTDTMREVDMTTTPAGLRSTEDDFGRDRRQCDYGPDEYENNDNDWTTINRGGRHDYRHQRTTRMKSNPDCRQDQQRKSTGTVGKLFFQILQVLHHVRIASKQMSGDLPQAFE